VRQLTTKRVPEFDGLRGVAICLVLAGHFGQFSLHLNGLWTACGEIGVLVFFVLSGFLITSLLCTEEESSSKGVDLRRFYVRRAFRLLPAAWMLIFTVAALKAFGYVTDESWGGVGASLCYVRNIFGRGTTLAHLWSLSLEEQFYFIWPLVFVVVPRRRLRVAVAVVAATVILRALGIGFGLADPKTGVFYLRPWFRFDSIMSGCVLALARERATWHFHLLSVWFSRIGHPLAAGLLLAVLSYFEWTRLLMPWCLSLETLVCTALLARLLSAKATGLQFILRQRPLTFIGRISYSIYLWQQLFIVTKTPDWGWLRRPVLDMAFTVGCALVSWYFIERPFLRLKSRWGADSVTLAQPSAAC